MRASNRVDGITRCKRQSLMHKHCRVIVFFNANKKLKPQAIASSMQRLLSFAGSYSSFKKVPKALRVCFCMCVYVFQVPSSFICTVKTLKFSKWMDICTITQATFTSPPHALRQGLSIDQQNCLQNSALICGTGAFNPIQQFQGQLISDSMSGCIIQCQWRFSSRRMDIELQADRPVHTEKTIQAHVLQRCKELKYTEKNNNCFVFVFFQCGGTLCNRLKLGIHRAERWFETKAAVEKKIKNGV